LTSASRTTIQAQPWRLPPLGPRIAASRIARTISSLIGSVDR
jgi:hypothetical protein